MHCISNNKTWIYQYAYKNEYDDGDDFNDVINRARAINGAIYIYYNNALNSLIYEFMTHDMIKLAICVAGNIRNIKLHTDIWTISNRI